MKRVIAYVYKDQVAIEDTKGKLVFETRQTKSVGNGINFVESLNKERYNVVKVYS